MVRAAVLGASGYLGGELLRLLSLHPKIEVAQVFCRSHAERTVGEVHPNLERSVELKFESDPQRVDTDLAFVAEPALSSMKIVGALLDRGVRVIDLGPDYRFTDANVFRATYGADHADQSHLAEAVYGLPELFRERLRSARLVANPGCYATATLLALWPLVRHDLLTGPVVVDAKSGSSGAGAAPTAASHHPEAALSVVPYGLPVHRHLPEIRTVLAQVGPEPPTITFVPHLVPLVRGILCSIYPTLSSSTTSTSLAELYTSVYRGSPFVRVGGVPKLPWATGTNRCYLSATQVGDAPVVFSALDNLGKGGAAQAVQNANVLFGFDERTGLEISGFGV
ncbi:MAG: N-acetyl-gamma-glutamyl-phosphate reductase [Thermoplasmata archaeon]|nr:N-acetyl-gamma-glutamyl-phosphate reductase [Thermoplasmata archaeon]